MRGKPRFAVLFRKGIFLAHLWLGLILGLYLVLIGLTGSLLVFMEEIDAGISPRLYQVEPKGGRLPIDQAFAPVREKHPNRRLDRVTLPHGAEGTYEFLLARKTGGWGPGDMLVEARVDPYTGEILGERPRYGAFFNIVFYFHMELVLGKTGRMLNSYGSLFAAAMLLTGLYLWWPAALKQWPIRLMIKRDGTYRRVIHDLHNVLGIWPLPVLLLAVLTGVAIMFPKPVADLAHWLTRSRPEPPTPKVAAGRGESLPLETLLRAGERVLREQVPGAEVTRLYPAKKPGQPLRLLGKFTEAGPASGYVNLRLDPPTGRVLQLEDPRTAGPAKRLLRWIGPLHFGTWGGAGVKVLYVLAGLAPLGLFVTGVLKWLEKRRAKQKNRARRDQSPARASVAAHAVFPALSRHAGNRAEWGDRGSHRVERAGVVPPGIASGEDEVPGAVQGDDPLCGYPHGEPDALNRRSRVYRGRRPPCERTRSGNRGDGEHRHGALPDG